MTEVNEIMSGTINEKLHHIQQNLKAPKNKHNAFGNYEYRSLEGILEGVKPLLKETGCTIVIKDSIELFGDRVFMKATAILSDGSDTIKNTSYAEHARDKKGMDLSQVTGSASSYARKYACNGLFAIDDNQDADDMDNRVEKHHNGKDIIPGKVTQDQSIKMDRYARDPKTTNEDKIMLKEIAKAGYIITETEANIIIADVEIGRDKNKIAPKKDQDQLAELLKSNIESKDEDLSKKATAQLKWLDKEKWTVNNIERVYQSLNKKENTNGVRK
tara:strand:+ start:503 stop:1321 length:819 start_codon:yes stop_codon:yes gene_type:complete